MFLVIPGAETRDSGGRLSGLWGLRWLLPAPRGVQHLLFHLHLLRLGEAPPSAQTSRHFLPSVQCTSGTLCLRCLFCFLSLIYLQVQAQGLPPRGGLNPSSGPGASLHSHAPELPSLLAQITQVVPVFM